jgi:hypothetical protein
MTATSAFPYDDIVERLTVRHIQTPVDRLLGFSVEDSAEEARVALEKSHFDFGPVRRNGEVIGLTGLALLVDQLRLIGDLFEPLGQSFLATWNLSRTWVAWPR